MDVNAVVVYFNDSQCDNFNIMISLNDIWGENYFGTDRVVDDLIRRLRKKMPLLDINTIYGYGYRLL